MAFCERDDRLGEVKKTIGPVSRDVHDDLFSALINAIVGQTDFPRRLKKLFGKRMLDGLGASKPE